jgi:Uncharacterized protein conserved in bacteria (DUF2255)
VGAVLVAAPVGEEAQRLCRRGVRFGASRPRRAGGVERDVRFVEAGADVHADLDAAYHAKYDRYGSRTVGSVVGPDAAGVTLRVEPA